MLLLSLPIPGRDANGNPLPARPVTIPFTVPVTGAVTVTGPSTVTVRDTTGNTLGAPGLVVGFDGSAGATYIATVAGTTTGYLTATVTPPSEAVVFDVTSYGAAGDGIQDDTDAFVAANSAASAATPPGTVLFPGGGTYRVSRPLVPGAGVTVTGDGMYNSIVTVDPSDYDNFDYSYILDCSNNNVTIRELGVDGQKRNGTNPANECGGVSLGPFTYLQNVRVDDPNYFGIWVSSTAAHAQVVGCHSARGGNNDSIGGGGGTDVRIVRHVWESTLAGNRFDNVNGEYVVLDGCVDLSANPGGVYLEGMTRSGVQNSFFLAGCGINVQSDGGYSPSTVTNPLLCWVRNNYVYTGDIQLEYNETISSVNKGGYNKIDGNTVELSPQWGILVLQGASTTYSYGHDVISHNTIRNPNTNDDTTADDGINTVYVGAITCDTPGLIDIYGNRTIDERSTPYTQMPVTTSSGGPFYIHDNDFGPSVYGLDPQHGAALATRDNIGSSYIQPIPVPSVPASGTAVTNTNYTSVIVYIYGGTVSDVEINGTSTGLTTSSSGSATVRLAAGQSITLTYSGTPTWTWFAD